MSTTTTEVKVGQVWADVRAPGRTVRVDAIDGARAVCRTLSDRYGPLEPHQQRVTTVLLRRFRPTSTGYRLLEDVP